ncbi:putative steroid-binding protein 3 [Meyerozyma sp. JA9]|jgi:predicted heme/steroid binding protein|nr:putative steroid-binding protein 3 [Meyerozyma sp. JA9]
MEPQEDIVKHNESVRDEDLEIFTRSQLSLYDGKSKPLVYVGIRGYVFDVTPNKASYGPGKSYNVFVGKDATRLLALNKLKVTGDITDSNTWSTEGLTEKQLEAVDKWMEYFKKRYKIVGLVVAHEN